MAVNEEFKNYIRNVFTLKEASLDDVADEVTKDEQPQENNDDVELELSDDDMEMLSKDDETDADGYKQPKGNEDNNEEPQTQDAPEQEMIPGTGDKVALQGNDDASKVNSLFKDTNNPESDYALTNPANIRLSKFKFKNAGIDIDQLVSETEKKTGLTADKLIYRLTPEQFDSYRNKSKDLRKKYDLIKEREKNIVIYNSRIPIYYLDTNTKEMTKLDENNPNLLKNAFGKIDKYMINKFGEDWVDNNNAIDFIQGIKVNFNEIESITPNMITTKFFSEGDKLTPFNKLYVKVPESVLNFISENKDNQLLHRSSVFRTIAAGYLNGSTDSNGVYPMIKVDNENADEPSIEPPKDTEEQESTDTPEETDIEIPDDEETKV